MENISYKWHTQHDARLSVISFFYSTTPYHIVTVTHIRTRDKWGSSQWTFCPWAEWPGGWERHWLYLKHSNPITKKWQNVNHCQFCIINNKNWYGWYHPLSFPIFSIFSKLKKDNHLEPEAFSVSWGLPWLDGRRPWTTLHGWKHREWNWKQFSNEGCDHCCLLLPTESSLRTFFRAEHVLKSGSHTTNFLIKSKIPNGFPCGQQTSR